MPIQYNKHSYKCFIFRRQNQLFPVNQAHPLDALGIRWREAHFQAGLPGMTGTAERLKIRHLERQFGRIANGPDVIDLKPAAS